MRTNQNLMDKIELLAVSLGEGGIAGAFRVLLNTARPFVDLLIYLSGTLVGKVTVAVGSLTIVLSLLGVATKYLIVLLYSLGTAITIAEAKIA